MEFSDYDIHGEILFPRMNSQFSSLSYQTISNTTFLNYRNTLLQGELLHFYVLLKMQGSSFDDSFDILNNIHFKLSFQSTESNTPNDNNNNNNSASFRLFPTNIPSYPSENENVINKIYDNTNNIMIYHIIKHIFVPPVNNDNIVLLQLNIMTKNDNTDLHINNNNDDNLLEAYHNGYFKYIDEYKVIKTLFKEVKIINIVNISNIKQYNVELNTSLLQLKLENITGDIDLIDTSLKYSKYLKEASQNEIEQFHTSNNKGIDLTIQNIQILKEQTTINTILTNSQYIHNINISDFIFEMFNKEFPINIYPTEQYNLILKITKPTYLNETLSQIYIHNTNEQDNNNSDNTNISFPYCLNVSQTFISNKTSPLQSKQFHLQFSSPTLSKSLDNVSVHMINNNNNYNIIEDNNNIDDNIDVVKVYFNTPVIFEITSNIFYDKLYICIVLTWCNEINRLLKVEMVNPKNIVIYEYFDICLKVKNISSYEMDISVEINDDDNNDINNVNTIPSVLSQIQTQSYGMLKPNEHKEIVLRFLPLTIGFIHLPNIVLIDNISKKRFHIVCNSKLLVCDNTM